MACRAPERYAGAFLALRVAVPGGLFLAYALRGRYPELTGLRADARLLLDVGIGLLGAALWAAPFLLWDSLRPDLRGAFDYATLSTTDLDQVERFAILVSSDAAGSAILEASPPAR